MKFSCFQYDKLGSTNDEALRFVTSGKAVEGQVFRAAYQLQGRGAGQNTWESEPGKNLIFSLILEPVFIRPSRQFVLTEMASLALFDVVERKLGGKYLAVKWPNDLYFRDKKLAGILIQNRINGNKIDFSVLGVGLNVNQKEFRSDAPNPASLVHFTGKEEDVSHLLTEILERLDFYYEKLKRDTCVLEAAYVQRLYRYNIWDEYEDAIGRFTAKITGVDQYGQLLLTDCQGAKRVYGFKEIRFL